MKTLFLFILLIPISKVLSQDINFGRIAYYPFNGSAQDEAGDLDGIVQGASLAKDRFGNNNSAYSFDGFNDFIEIPHDQLINFGTKDDFTISLWINAAQVQNDMEGTNSGLISKWDEYNSTSYPFSIRYWNKNESSSREERIFALRYDSNGCDNNPAVSGECKVTAAEWHHILFRKKGTQIAYFQDGVLQGVQEDNTSAICDTKNNKPVLIGKRGRNQRYFTGFIDDIIFYNRAITDKEINLLFSEKGWESSSSEVEIVSFSFSEQIMPTIIDNENKTITAKVSCDADLSSLIANFSLSTHVPFTVNGVTQVSGVSVNDFTYPVVYTLQECLGEKWSVTVTKEQFNQEEIDNKTAFKSFNLPEQIGETLLDLNDHSIALVVSCTSNLSSLVPTFSLPGGAQAKVSGVLQQSGITPNNFSLPVQYIVSNTDGCINSEWTINIKQEQFSQEEKDLKTAFTSFSLPGQKGAAVINTKAHTIAIEIPCGKDLSNIAPTFNLSLGAIAKVKEKVQESGITLNNFADTVFYRVFDEQGCIVQDWKVTTSKYRELFKNIDFSSSNYFLPNVITPNNDPKNQTFQIGNLLMNSEMALYNRYGRRVYFNKNYLNNFDGNNLSSGVYFYTIKSPCVEKPIKGYLHIVKN